MIEEKVTNLVKDVIENAGYILDSVSYVKEGSTKFLRIVVDKNGGYINVEDCVTINGLVDPLIDTLDREENYILDICSKEKGEL